MAEETPHLIHKVALDPLAGPQPYQGRELAFKLGLTGKQVQQFTKISWVWRTSSLSAIWR